MLICKSRRGDQEDFKDPISFVGNLVNAGKMGFQNFANNIGTHLKRRFWSGSPDRCRDLHSQSLTLKNSPYWLVCLGITWANIRQSWSSHQ